MNIKSRTDRIIYALIVFSGGTHLLTFTLGSTLLDQWAWKNVPVHSALEISGSLVALLTAVILLQLESKDEGASFNVPIAAALVGMGVLDGLHALTTPDQYFVYLHSIATFVGGLLFAVVLLPDDWIRALRKAYVVNVAALALVAGLVPGIFPALLPTMFDVDGFTPTAQLLNISGGVLLLAAGARLYQRYRSQDNYDDLLFVLLCVLFGAAGIMFQQSQLWDFPWWSWHFLRALAYAVAVYFVFQTDRLVKEKEEVLSRVLAREVETRREAEHRALDLLNELRSTQQQMIRVEKLSTVGSMVGGVAHEINNPLMGLSNYVSYARSKLEPGRPRDKLDDAMVQIGRIDRIVKNLLLFSRNKPHVGDVATDFKQVLERVIAIVDVQMHAAAVTVERDGNIALPPIAITADSLEQILINLLLNAKDVVPGDRTGRIVVAAEAEGEDVLISVEDNGPGVPDDIRFRIFDPFFTTKDQTKGTGLGLSVCAQLAALAQGSLVVSDSAHLGGARFQLTVKVAAGDPG